jgi:hypothetical protein
MKMKFRDEDWSFDLWDDVLIHHKASKSAPNQRFRSSDLFNEEHKRGDNHDRPTATMKIKDAWVMNRKRWRLTYVWRLGLREKKNEMRNEMKRTDAAMVYVCI